MGRNKKRKVIEIPDTYPTRVRMPGCSETIQIFSPDFAYSKLDSLFEKNRPALHKAAMRIMHDYQWAEDIVQSTLVGIYHTLNNGKLYILNLESETIVVKGGWTQPSDRSAYDNMLLRHWVFGAKDDAVVYVEKPAAWIMTSLRNTATTRYTREKIHREFCENSKNWELAVDPADPNPERVFLDEERRAEIRAMVATLPPRYSKVVELRYFEGRQFAEIAQIVNRPAKTVEQQSRRGLAMIGDIMRERRVMKNGRYVLKREPA